MIEKQLKAVSVAYKEFKNAFKYGKTLVHHAGHKIGEKPLMQPQFLSDNETKIACGEL